MYFQCRCIESRQQESQQHVHAEQEIDQPRSGMLHIPASTSHLHPVLAAHETGIHAHPQTVTYSMTLEDAQTVHCTCVAQASERNPATVGSS
jgi:hypothetical protein